MEPQDIPRRVRYRVSNTWVTVTPGSQAKSTDLRKSSKLPTESLELEFAYGVNSACGLFALGKASCIH